MRLEVFSAFTPEIIILRIFAAPWILTVFLIFQMTFDFPTTIDSTTPLVFTTLRSSDEPDIQLDAPVSRIIYGAIDFESASTSFILTWTTL